MTKQIPNGYKQTKVGIIPEDWDVVKIGDVCDCIVPGRNKPVNFNGNIPWVTTPDITTKYICDTKSNLYITIEEAKKIGSKVVPKNSVIMSCVGELGLLSIVKKEIVINQQLHAFIPSAQVNTEFLHYVLGTQKKYMDSVATKTAVPYMNKDNCNSIPIPLPKVKEQEKIAEILSTWDDAITKQEQLIEQNQVFKKGLMQQIFSQKIRFKDDKGNNYPAWKEMHLNAIIEINPKSESLPDYFYYIDLECVNAGRVGKLDYISSNNAPSRAQRILSTNDILFQMVRPYQRNNLLFNIISEDNYVASTGYAQLRAKERHSYKFIFQLLLTDDFVKSVMLRCTGTSYPAISSSDLSTIIVNVPKREEQTKIADFLTSFDDGITIQNNILDQLKLQKQSLMQKLLTGQVRVKYES